MVLDRTFMSLGGEIEMEGPSHFEQSWLHGKALGRRYPGPTNHYAFGDPVSFIESQLLEDGIESSYPCIDPLADPEGRFNLYPSEENPLEYIVDDAELSLQLPIPKKCLLNPTFDLVSWYFSQLENSGLYNLLYLAKSLKIYEDELGHLEINKPIPGIELSAQSESDLLVSAMDLTEDLFEEDFESETSESVLGDPPELQPLTDSDSEWYSLSKSSNKSSVRSIAETSRSGSLWALNSMPGIGLLISK